MTKTCLLDASALLTLRDDEPGADQVSELLAQVATEDAVCYGCFISLMEVLYRVWKDEGEDAGRLAYAQCQSLPIIWIHESSTLLEKAAEIKARHPLSVADAWIAATASMQQAELVHKDPEFEKIPLAQIRLPYKKKRS